jgi:uncharacterized protein
VQPSIYNLYVDIPEGCYIYNGVSCSLTKTNRRTLTALQAGRVSPAMLANEALVENGVITSSHKRQLASLKKRFEKVRRPSNHCVFVISPTTGCNLACPYCYEHASIPKKNTMTKAMALRTAKFVCHEMNMPGRDHVLLKFYGGEPLLRLDLCQLIAEYVGDWCDKHKKQFVSWVQSNGTLITDEMPIEKIRNLACVEITVDGDAKRHNQLRVERTGAPTYQRIIDAIHIVVKRGVFVILRLNMHNASEVKKTLADLDRHGVFDLENVRFYDGQVSDAFVTDKFGGECFGHAQTESMIKMMQEVRSAILNSKWKHKYQRFPRFVLANGICSYNKPGNYCIDPKGDLHTCVFQQCRASQKVGTITADGVPKFNRMYEQIMNRTPFAFEQCVKCPILSQCWGGCFAQAVDREGTVDAPYCGTMLQTVPALLAANLQEKQDEAVEVQRVRSAK